MLDSPKLRHLDTQVAPSALPATQSYLDSEAVDISGFIIACVFQTATIERFDGMFASRVVVGSAYIIWAPCMIEADGFAVDFVALVIVDMRYVRVAFASMLAPAFDA